MYDIISQTTEETRALGRCLGRQIRTGAVIRLYGDLGSGKTCFVQGLAMGLDVPEAYAVTSPSYTLINEYPGRLPLYHIDLYRLAGEEDAQTIGFWDILGRDAAVVAVEWADRIAEELWPSGHITIEFHLTAGPAHRLRIHAYGLEWDSLVKEALVSWKANLR